MDAVYRIEDEPRRGALSQLAVNPLWPLLCLMLGGFGLGSLWFLVNGFALGSPTRRREAFLVVVGLSGAALLGGAWLIGLRMALIPEGAASEYGLLPLWVWKLTVGYCLYNWQSRTLQIYEYFGGVLRSGLPLLILAAVVGRRAMLAAVQNDLWQTIVA